jgi:hypothetical protein
MEVIDVRVGHPRHPPLISPLREPELADQWWDDAESHAEATVSYMVVYAPDPSGAMVPAAWAGWVLGGNALRCCDNYVRRGFRRRRPELYEMAYRARHRQVVQVLGLPGVTYLFPEPVGLHLRDGWVRDTSPGSSGTRDGRPEHRWQRLLWTPDRLRPASAV